MNSLLCTQSGCGDKPQTAARQFSICESLPQQVLLQATSSNVRELSCLEVEKVSPTLRGSVCQLRDGLEDQNAKLLAKEQAKATKAQKKHARMQLIAK